MRPRLRLILGIGLAAVGGYLILLFIVSLRSQERILGFNQPKPFCGFYLDCHRRVEVAEVARDGAQWIVTLRYRSDAMRAKQSMRGLSARVRAGDRWFERNTRAERAMGSAGLPSMTLDPGEAFTTRLVFDLPDDAEPLLYVWDNHPASRLSEVLLVGDEDSFLHRRTFFALDPGAPTATMGGLSVSVVEVETDTTAGAPHPVPADGVFYLVTLSVEGRGRFEARVVGRDGREWRRAHDVERLLTGDRRLVFDVDERIEAPVLQIRPAGRWRGTVSIPLS
ncbi:MAG: hypothetical protein WD934_01205 [Gemmatimonadales bacterium]